MEIFGGGRGGYYAREGIYQTPSVFYRLIYQYQPVSLSIPPLQNRFFVFGGGYSKIFDWVVFEGGVFSEKFSEKTQNVAALAAGF